MVALQLHLQDLDGQNCRNNLRLRGLPEDTGAENLPDMALAIFHKILGESPTTNLEFDRIHRTLGSRSTDPNRPCDVICRLHHYTHKEVLLRKAWEAASIDFEGSDIKNK